MLIVLITKKKKNFFAEEGIAKAKKHYESKQLHFQFQILLKFQKLEIFYFEKIKITAKHNVIQKI